MQIYNKEILWAQTSQNNLEIILKKLNKVGEFVFPDLKTYHKTAVTKIVVHWHKDCCRIQWNRIESSEVNTSFNC